MKEFIVRTLCDRKNIHPDTQEDASEVTLLNSKGRPVVVDMCEPCQKGITLIEALELADAIGQPTELPTPRGRKPKAAPGPCKVEGCGAEFDTNQGLGMHMYKVHGIRASNRKEASR